MDIFYEIVMRLYGSCRAQHLKALQDSNLHAGISIFIVVGYKEGNLIHQFYIYGPTCVFLKV